MNDSRRKKFLLPLGLAAALLLGLVAGGLLRITPALAAEKAAAPESPPPAPVETGPALALPSFADIAARALDSVVAITSTEIVKTPTTLFPFGNQDPFGFFFGPQPRRRMQEHKEVAGGSGFVISGDGYILTNNHVVAGAQKIQVKLRDREILPARVIGTDPSTDIALVKIDAKHRLSPLPLGDSDRLRVGDWVMAIGNPMNFAGTVTVGVVSAKERGGLTDDPNAASFEDFIQTDAAINFGNSGGPLINVRGHVVGINTAIVQPAQNIGFAVPINAAKAILPQLETKGHVVRGMLGITVRNVDQSHREAFHLPSIEGAFVESVENGKPAEKAGLRPGDTIVRADEVPVKEVRDLIRYVSSKPPGTRVRLTYLRGGKTETTTATLAERPSPEQPPAPQASEKGAGQRLGITVTELTPDLRQELSIPRGVTGVVVEHVREISPAADEGIQQGDLITQVNGVAVDSIGRFREELAKVRKGEYIRLYVRRFAPQEVSRFVILKAEE